MHLVAWGWLCGCALVAAGPCLLLAAGQGSWPPSQLAVGLPLGLRGLASGGRAGWLACV